MTRGRRAWAVWRITRAENCLLAAAATLIGATTATQPASMGLARPVLASVAVLLVLAFGNVVNDIRDVETDRRWKPRRPLPRGTLSMAGARRLASALLAASVLFSLAQPPLLRALVVAMCAVAALYSWSLKGVPLLGNLVFAAQCGATVVFGALAAGRPGGRTAAAALPIALGILCVEVAKTIEDGEGDAEAGTTTIAHLLPAGPQRRLVAALGVSYVACVLAFLGSVHHPWLYAVAVVPVVPLLAFGLGRQDGNPLSHPARGCVLASKALWPLVLVGLVGVR